LAVGVVDLELQVPENKFQFVVTSKIRHTGQGTLSFCPSPKQNY